MDTTNKIDKEFLFKSVTRIIADELNLKNVQMNKIMNTLTSIFD